jgi:hypothetical protein
MKSAERVSFDHETIMILRTVLDEVWAALLPEQPDYLRKSVVAERILKLAARGERDPDRLRTAALMEAMFR